MSIGKCTLRHGVQVSDLRQTSGKRVASTSTWRIPNIPTAAATAVHVRKVSPSLNPDIRPTTQNPLSFIQEAAIEPNPTAAKR